MVRMTQWPWLITVSHCQTKKETKNNKQIEYPKYLFSLLLKIFSFLWKMKIKGKAKFHGRCQNEAKGCWFWCVITLPLGGKCAQTQEKWLKWAGDAPCPSQLPDSIVVRMQDRAVIIAPWLCQWAVSYFIVSKQWLKEKTPFLSHPSWGLAHYPSQRHLKPQRIMWKIWGH